MHIPLLVTLWHLLHHAQIAATLHCIAAICMLWMHAPQASKIFMLRDAVLQSRWSQRKAARPSCFSVSGSAAQMQR